MRFFRSLAEGLTALVLMAMPLASQADGLINRSATSLGLCYGSGSSGALVPCVLAGNTWTRVYRPGDDANFNSVAAGSLAGDGSVGISVAPSPMSPVGSLGSHLSGLNNALALLPQTSAATDYTAVLNAVIGAGKRVYLPYTGTPYLISGKLTFASNGAIEAAPGVVIQRASGVTADLFYVPPGVSGARVANARFDCQAGAGNLAIIAGDHFSFSGSGATGCGTLFISGSVATYNRVTESKFLNGTSTAITLQLGANNNDVYRSEFQNNFGFGIFSTLGSYSNNIVGNWTDRNNIELIGVTFDSYENLVLGNRAQATGDNGISISGRANRVIGNIATGCAFIGIAVIGDFNNVVGNTAKNNGQVHNPSFWAYNTAFDSVKYSGINIGGSYGGGGQLNTVGPNFVDDDQATPTQDYGVNISTGYASWGSGATYSTSTYVYNSGNVYKSTNAGTSGSTAPTHTSGDVSDGGVTWRYISTLPIATREPSGNKLDLGVAYRAKTAFFNDSSSNKNNAYYLDNRFSLSSNLHGIGNNLVTGGFNLKVGTNWANNGSYTYGQLVYTNAGSILYRVVNAGGTSTVQPTHTTGTVTTSDGIAWLAVGAGLIPNSTPQLDLNAQYVGVNVPMRIPVMETIGGYANIFAGQGTPEGKVTAPIGSLYLNQSGTSTTALYVKGSGAGNTGWVAK